MTDIRDSLPILSAFSIWAATLIALIFAVVFGIFGALLAYRALFPPHTICTASHDEIHGGYPVTLCDKRVTR